MKYGINSCALDGYDEAEAIRKAAALGYDGIEPGVDERINSRTACRDFIDSLLSRAPKLRQVAADSGIEIPSLCAGVLWYVNLAAGAYEEREFATELVGALVGVCKALGAKVLLLPVGTPYEYSPEQARENLVQSLRRCAAVASAQGVVLGLENICQDIIRDAQQLADVVDAVDSPSLKAYYDLGNAALLGQSPADDIRLLGSRICMLHVKDMELLMDAPPPPRPGYGNRVLTRGDSAVWDMGVTRLPGSGCIDWQAATAAIEAIGYNGYMVNEVVSQSGDSVARGFLDYFHKH